MSPNWCKTLNNTTLFLMRLVVWLQYLTPLMGQMQIKTSLIDFDFSQTSGCSWYDCSHWQPKAIYSLVTVSQTNCSGHLHVDKHSLGDFGVDVADPQAVSLMGHTLGDDGGVLHGPRCRRHECSALQGERCAVLRHALQITHWTYIVSTHIDINAVWLGR